MTAENVLNRENADGATERARRGPRLPWPLLAVNFILMALILIGGFLYTRQQIGKIEIDKKNELRAIAALKTSQIRHWLDDIQDSGRFLHNTMNNNARFIEKLKIKPADFNVSVSAWLKAFKDFQQFAEIYFLDRQSRSVWIIAARAEPADPRLAGELQADFDAREVSISDLYFSRVFKRISLNLRVPIGAVPTAANGPQAMLLFSIDPGQSLFPLIQSWPTASPSAEILLVRREGDDVIYLNELRHSQNTALRLRAPIEKNETPAARAAQGEVGFSTGLDYRGVQVLADVHRVPGTSWSLIAKIDQEEVHLLVARQEWTMFALVFSVFLLMLLFSAYFWRRQQVSFLRRQVTSDAALQESENRYRLLIENQSEGIGLVDTADRFIFANPAGHEIFGVQPGMLIGRNLNEFLRTAESDKIRQKTTARPSTGKETYEMNMVRPDGQERILLVTVTPRFDESGQFSGTFGIFRDITERKCDEEKIIKMLAEKELLLKEVHHRVKNNMMVIGSLLQIQAQRISDPKTLTVLQESQNRIHAMMTIYEKLYRTADLTHIGLGDYFSELAKSLFAAYNIRPGTIALETAISDIELDIDQTIPCGLIINELVSNTLKYAFPGDRKGRIRIEFGEITADGRGTPPFGDKSCRSPNEETDVRHEKGTARRAPTDLDRARTYALTVANNGVPLPANFDITKSTGFGLQLVIMLAGQLGGTLKTSSGTGTEFQVTFPANQTKQRGADA